MAFFGLFGPKEQKAAESIGIDTLIRRIEAVYDTVSGIQVTPDTAMQSPTVQAVVTQVSRRMMATPVHVLRTTMVGGRRRRERISNHPVARLLARPNDWQSPANYWGDATSWLLRYGRHYAFKARGQTGPIRRLEPLKPDHVQIEQDDDLRVTFKVNRSQTGAFETYDPAQIHHVRGPARDGLTGDSPIMDVREAIALEIAAEKFGGSVFGNYAVPGMIFQFAQGSYGFKTQEEQDKFLIDFQDSFTRKGRFRGMVIPPGMETGAQIPVENEKAQFLETRKLQRNIIAGALGVPPHLAGDLERATFSNIEHQSIEFIQAVVLPICRIFESAMERDLLTDEDRRSGVVIRFNLDGALRGDFKSRQEGLKIQREMGVINPNDWLETENMNPRTDPGGEEYWDQGPSGQGSAQADAPMSDEDSEDV